MSPTRAHILRQENELQHHIRYKIFISFFSNFEDLIKVMTCNNCGEEYCLNLLIPTGFYITTVS